MRDKINEYDICLWANGEWSYLGEIEQFPWRSDDYELLREGSEEWEKFVKEEEREDGGSSL